MNFLDKMSTQLLFEEVAKKSHQKGLTPEEFITVKDIISIIDKHASLHFPEANESRPKNPKVGEDIRFPFPMATEEVVDWIDSLLTQNDYTNFDYEIIEPKKSYKGERFSNSFDTIIIKNNDNDKMTIRVVVGTKAKSGFLRGKQLKPDDIGINGKTFSGYSNLSRETKRKIESKNINLMVKDYVLNLLDIFENGSFSKSENKIIISRSKENYENSKKLEKSDLNVIYKNFGEVLGAIILGRINKKEIVYPLAANEPFIDYYVGNIAYSAKYKKGAAPTISDIALNKYDIAVDIVGKNSDIIKIFDVIRNNTLTASLSYLELTKKLNPSEFKAFLNFMGVGNISIGKSYTPSAINKKMSEYYGEGILEERLEEMYSAIDQYPKDWPGIFDNYDDDNKERYGYITSVYAYRLQKYLNQGDIASDMAKIVEKLTDVVQINLYDKKDSFELKTNKMNNNISIEFVAGGSTNKPNHQNLRMRISGI